MKKIGVLLDLCRVVPLVAYDPRVAYVGLVLVDGAKGPLVVPAGLVALV